MPTIPDQIIGHTQVQGQLLADIAHGNISHAYLFIGPPHLGKSTVARWFMWRILADGKPPEELRSIKDSVERLIHPDLLSLDALWMKDVQEDWSIIGQSSNVSQQHRAKASQPPKTDTIGIDDVRLLQGRLFETGSSDHLCCFIRSIERMQTPAATAFLKILEEPPPRVVFILTAESEHALLPTIISRTRVLHFHPLPQSELRPLLQADEGDDEAFALHLSQGAPGAFLRLIGDPDTLRAKRQLHGEAKRFWQARSLLEHLSCVTAYADAKKDIDELLLHLGLTLREFPEDSKRPAMMHAYMQLLSGLRTNAHRGLLLERFALAVHSLRC